MKKFKTSYVYLTAFISAIWGGLFAKINLTSFLIFILLIVGTYVYCDNEESKEKDKKIDKVKKIKKKIQKYVGFDSPEYIENKSYSGLEKMLDELIKAGGGK